MAFKLDKEQNRSAAVAGGGKSALELAAAGASVGFAAGLPAGGVGALPGALIGAGIGLLAGGAIGAGTASVADKSEQKAAWEMEKAEKARLEKMKIDTAMDTQAAARSGMPSSVSRYAPMANTAPVGSSYDQWKAGGI